MTTTSQAADVHLRCVTPDFAASTYRLLKANQINPALLVGSLIVVHTTGTDEAIERVVAQALSTGLVRSQDITVTHERPAHLRALVGLGRRVPLNH